MLLTMGYSPAKVLHGFLLYPLTPLLAPKMHFHGGNYKHVICSLLTKNICLVGRPRDTWHHRRRAAPSSHSRYGGERASFPQPRRLSPQPPNTTILELLVEFIFYFFRVIPRLCIIAYSLSAYF